MAKYINIEILPRALPLVVMSGGYHPERRKSERDLETIRQHLWHDEQLQKVIREIARSLRRKPQPELPTEKPRPL